MVQPELPKHWAFALAVTTHELEQLTFHFDSTRQIPALNYANVPTPQELQNVAQGFLQDLSVTDLSYKRRLLTIAQNLRELIIPHYLLGVTQAQEIWQQSSHEQHALFAIWDAHEVMHLAKRYTAAITPKNACSWFIQGFCFTWWHDCLLDYIIQDTEK